MKILIASPPAQTTLGSTETLHCRIGRQGAHTVSWIRQVMVFHLSTIRLETRKLLHPIQGDLEILSVGSLLVSTNPRLAVHFDARVGDHVLTIRQVIMTMIMIIDYFDARVDDHVLTIRQEVMTKTMIMIVITDDITLE